MPVFPYRTYYQKYEPTEYEIRKAWKNICLFGGDGTDFHIRLQKWLEPILLQTKSISSTTKQCRLFKEEEKIVPQRLDLCAPVFFKWDPQ